MLNGKTPQRQTRRARQPNGRRLRTGPPTARLDGERLSGDVWRPSHPAQKQGGGVAPHAHTPPCLLGVWGLRPPRPPAFKGGPPFRPSIKALRATLLRWLVTHDDSASCLINIAAARVVDRECNYKFGSNARDGRRGGCVPPHPHAFPGGLASRTPQKALRAFGRSGCSLSRDRTTCPGQNFFPRNPTFSQQATCPGQLRCLG